MSGISLNLYCLIEILHNFKCFQELIFRMTGDRSCQTWVQIDNELICDKYVEESLDHLRHKLESSLGPAILEGIGKDL